MAIKHRPSAEIRQFLMLYLLERTSEHPFPPSALAAEIRRSSKGDLQPAEDDVRAAQIACWERGWLDCEDPFSNRAASLSAEGEVQLARLREASRNKLSGSDDREEAAGLLVSRLPSPDGEEVLDVGTGDGFLACKLAAVGFPVLAIDADREVVANARCEGSSSHSRVRFQAGDIRELAREGACFSRIVASYLLHERDDPVAVLQAICSCLGPGAFLGCMDLAPNSGAYLEQAGCTPFHPFRALAEEDWRHLAPQLGLNDLDWLTVGHVSIATARRSDETAAAGRQ
jgi:SAM-dependent methyltransferase